MLHELDIHALAEHEYDFAQEAKAQKTEFRSEHSRFEYPSWIWGLMFASYAIFFAAILFATGRDGETLFMIGISIGYTLMYFGTASIIASINARPGHDTTFLSQKIETWTGPLSTSAAAAQILTVPAMLALFGISIAVIRGLM